MSEKLSNFKCRKGSRFGHDTLVDAMLKDGLWDVYNDCAMGMCAELCADNHALTREDQVPYYRQIVDAFCFNVFLIFQHQRAASFEWALNFIIISMFHTV
jgi:hypothetical protein